MNLEFFIKNQKIITRVLGSLFLIVGFVAYFWATPKEGLSKAERAAANVARMEASIAGSSKAQTKKGSSKTKMLEELKNTQAKQLQYMMIIAMTMGVGFLAYSFIKKEED